MKIVLLHEGNVDVKAYTDKLRSWGIEYIAVESSLAGAWKENEVSQRWLTDFLAPIYKQMGEQIDVVQFLYSPKNWKGKFALLGIHYHKTYYGYQTCHIHQRKGWEKTALHELMHTFDDIVYLYTGKKLADVLGVKDFDESVVHGKEKGFKEYQYDAPYTAIKAILDDAILIRKRLATVSYLQKLLITLRGMKSKPVEEINEEPESKLYQVAVSFLGKDASPRDFVQDGVGCAESLSTILRSFLPTFQIVTGTWSLLDALKVHPSFVQAMKPIPGDIILCATGQGKGSVVNGHTGVMGLNGKIMSNDSRSGLWTENYTLEAWNKYFVDKGKFPIYYFRLK